MQVSKVADSSGIDLDCDINDISQNVPDISNANILHNSEKVN